jgi:hypothetical protein
LSTVIDKIAPDQLALLASLFAIVIADGLSANENAALGSFIAAVGDTVTLIGSQQIVLEARQTASETNQ